MVFVFIVVFDRNGIIPIIGRCGRGFIVMGMLMFEGNVVMFDSGFVVLKLGFVVMFEFGFVVFMIGNEKFNEKFGAVEFSSMNVVLSAETNARLDRSSADAMIIAAYFIIL